VLNKGIKTARTSTVDKKILSYRLILYCTLACCSMFAFRKKSTLNVGAPVRLVVLWLYVQKNIYYGMSAYVQ